MTRFNPATYDPAADSTPNTSGEGLVRVISRIEGRDKTVVELCHSGSGEPVTSGRRFRQGGDAQLKGKLIRAHLAGAKVTTVSAEGTSTATALAVAKTYGWEAYLKAAEERQNERTAARKVREATKKAAAKKSPAKKAAAKKATKKAAASGSAQG